MNIKQLRTELKLTQTDLAVACGVSLSTIRMWEKKVTTPNEENLLKLKKALRIEV